MQSTALDYQVYLRKLSFQLLRVKINTAKPLFYSLDARKRDQLKKLYVNKYSVSGFQELLNQAKEANTHSVIWDSLDSLIEEKINSDLVMCCNEHLNLTKKVTSNKLHKLVAFFNNTNKYNAIAALAFGLVITTGAFGIFQANEPTFYEFNKNMSSQYN